MVYSPQRSDEIGAHWENVKNGTDLCLGDDREKDICDMTVPTPRNNEQYETDSVESTRLNKYGDDCHVEPAGCFSGNTKSTLNVPPMQDEPDDDHEREEEVKGKGNRKEGVIEVTGDRAPAYSR